MKENTRTRIKATLSWLAAIVFYYCWFQALYNSLQYDSIYPYPNFKIALNAILSNFIPISIVFILNILIAFRPLRKAQMKQKIIIDLMLSFVVVIIVNYIYILFVKKNVDWTGTLLNYVLIFLWVEVVYYFKNYNKSRLEAEESAKKAMQYRYDALKSQINPHFLFNSLNLLSSLVSVDPEKSKIFIHGLASMYRYIMAREGEKLASVKKELDFLQSYVSVLEMRYNNKFSVIYEGTAKEEALIVPYTMQLLIENVTKHNVISKNYPMTVTVRLKSDGIEVRNPIRLKPTSTSGGIGLNYLKELYASFGKAFRTDKDKDTFVAYIPYIDL